jgi:hypothetical protein
MQAFRTKLKTTVSRNPNFVLGATSCHLGDFLFKYYDIKRASLYKISTSHYNKSSIIFINELCLGRRLSEYYLTASKLYNARFQVITEVLLTIQVFCDVPSCRLVNSYHVFASRHCRVKWTQKVWIIKLQYFVDLHNLLIKRRVLILQYIKLRTLV